jgi:hypothetical protein
VCAWLAIASRVLLGGCRYRGVLISRAASSAGALRRSAFRVAPPPSPGSGLSGGLAQQHDAPGCQVDR